MQIWVELNISRATTAYCGNVSPGSQCRRGRALVVVCLALQGILPVDEKSSLHSTSALHWSSDLSSANRFLLHITTNHLAVPYTLHSSRPRPPPNCQDQRCEKVMLSAPFSWYKFQFQVSEGNSQLQFASLAFKH